MDAPNSASAHISPQTHSISHARPPHRCSLPSALLRTEETSAENALPTEPSQPVRRKVASAPCRYFRRGYCRYGASCYFQHSEAASGGGDGVPEVAVCRYFLQGNCKKGRNCRFRHYLNVYEYMMRKLICRVEDEDEDEDEDDGLEQRMANGGFTDEEVNELACQGIKPWDSEAWDVLAILNGMQL